MSDVFLSDDLAAQYLGALIAIARTDGEITPEESTRLHAIAARRSRVPVDDELLFFSQVTPEAIAAAAASGGEHRGGVAAREVGIALLLDAIELATSDGDLNGREATAILRYVRALGCTDDVVRAHTPLLEEWLTHLVH
jgi:tellurite resistance protein